MARTVLFLTYFWIGMVFAVLTLIPFLLLRLFRFPKAADAYVHRMCAFWCRHFMTVGGARVKVTGLENIPIADKVCLVCNHQSLADIPTIIGWIPLPVTFIAKQELFRVPLLGLWLKAMRVIPLNRRNGHSAIEAINRGVEYIDAGRPVVIFPEGTRSRGDSVGRFKAGSMKLAVRSGAVILPLTVSNAYKLAEDTGRLKPARVSLHVHPAIDVKSLSEEKLKTLSDDLRDLVGSAVVRT